VTLAPTEGREAILPLLPHLRAYARSLTADPHAADDLVQDTLLFALQAWDTFTPGTNLKAWLFRILRNRHLSLRGRHARRLEVAVDDPAVYGSVPASQESHAELRHFKAAFASLAPSHREVLGLWAVHGLSYEQIAAIADTEVSSVKSRMNRARTTLKALVRGDRPIRARTVPAAPRLVVPAAPLAPAVLLPPAWLADSERRLAQAELQVTRCRLVLARMARTGMPLEPVETVLRLAEGRLASFEAHRLRLLDAAPPLADAA
jgi:RNA polymerase sigma-70 factor, ECF subfamily